MIRRSDNAILILVRYSFILLTAPFSVLAKWGCSTETKQARGLLLLIPFVFLPHIEPKPNGAIKICARWMAPCRAFKWGWGLGYHEGPFRCSCLFLSSLWTWTVPLPTFLCLHFSTLHSAVLATVGLDSGFATGASCWVNTNILCNALWWLALC